MSARPACLVSRLYYRLDSSQPQADVQGDALLQALYRPLIDGLLAALPGAHISWMRFCVQGYHLRLHVLDSLGRLQERARPLIERAVAEFVTAQPQFFSGPMQLPELAQRLSQQFANTAELLPAGTHQLELLELLDVPAPTPGAGWQAWLMSEAGHSLDLLPRLRSYGQRQMFWRCYSVHMLQMLALDRPGCIELLSHWSARWQSKFGLSDEALAAREQQLRGQHHLARLLHEGQPPWEWQGLPPTLAWPLRELARVQQAQRVQGLAQQAPGGEGGSAEWLLQATALLHLCANRLGVSVLDEAAHARSLALGLSLQAVGGLAHGQV